jgi:hypothetical protein
MPDLFHAKTQRRKGTAGFKEAVATHRRFVAGWASPIIRLRRRDVIASLLVTRRLFAALRLCVNPFASGCVRSDSSKGPRHLSTRRVPATCQLRAWHWGAPGTGEPGSGGAAWRVVHAPAAFPTGLISPKAPNGPKVPHGSSGQRLLTVAQGGWALPIILPARRRPNAWVLAARGHFGPLVLWVNPSPRVRA